MTEVEVVDVLAVPEAMLSSHSFPNHTRSAVWNHFVPKIHFPTKRVVVCCTVAGCTKRYEVKEKVNTHTMAHHLKEVHELEPAVPQPGSPSTSTEVI